MFIVKDLFVKYKNDFYCVLGLLLVFLVCTIVSWGTFGALYYDCGREVLLPQWILEGKIIFKDVFAMYLPLPYYINALFYKIFGQSITILQILGCINTFIIIAVLYGIMRVFTDRYYSFSMCIFIILFYIFRSFTCMNYIFPYAYAMIYSLSAMLFSVLCGLLFVKTSKTFFIPLAYLMLGLSVANKPEFIFCIIPLVIITVLSHKNTFRLWLLNIAAFVMPSVLSWGVLFLQGFGTEDFRNYYNFLDKFFKTEEQRYYTLHFVKLPFSINNILAVCKAFLVSAVTITYSVLSLRLLTVKRLRFIGIILTAGLFVLLLHLNNILTVSVYQPLSWVYVTSFIIAVISLKNKDKKLGFISLCAVLSCARTDFITVQQVGYSMYLILLPVITTWIYIVQRYGNIICEKFKIKYQIILSLIIIAVSVFTFNTILKNVQYMAVNTNNKGVLKASKELVIPFNKTVEWILTNTNDTDRVVVLPEGPMINFITQRPTLPKYYHLIPNHISALGEDNVVKGLSEDMPEYFVINNTEYSTYNKPHICEDFGFDICRFIENNYTLQVVYRAYSPKGKPHTSKIYKLGK